MFDNGKKLSTRHQPPFTNRAEIPVTDASKVDFRNPENFFHDVNSVAGLLKQFFRDLPDPLLTTEHYAEFIDAARTYLLFYPLTPPPNRHVCLSVQSNN